MSNLTEDAPCARGCTWDAASEGEAPRPKPAKHGHLCNSCFYRLTGALKLVPDLMANMRANLFTMGTADYSDKVSGGGGESPAPLNIGPLDASDALYAKLIGWTEVFSEELAVRAPTFPTWANGREVQGSKPVTVEQAHDMATRLVGWLTDRLDEIAAGHIAERAAELAELGLEVERFGPKAVLVRATPIGYAFIGAGGSSRAASGASNIGAASATCRGASKKLGAGSAVNAASVLTATVVEARCPAASSARRNPLTIMPRTRAASRKRTSVLAGWTLTSMKSAGQSRNSATTGCRSRASRS